MLTITNKSLAAMQPGLVRRLTMGFLGLSLIAGFLGNSHAQNTNWSPLPPFYAPTPPAVPVNPPLPGGGNGWTPFPAGGIVLAPNATVAFAFQNEEDLEKRKYFRIEIQTANKNDIQCLAPADKGAYNSAGAPFKKNQITYNGGGFRAGANPNERYDEWIFSPCPAWEWVSYKNTCNRPITISSVRAGSLCSSVRPSFHALLAQGLHFGAPGPGTMVTNDFINQVMLFPQTVAIDTSVPMTFSAPTNSGNWTASPIFVDPFGNPAPLGGVLYTSDGPGLDPSMSCNFSFSMQGPAADLQYTMYAYDSTMAEFQEYTLDLRPTLTITPSSNAFELDFNSVPGLNYVLQGSADLHTWSPLQTFSGTGGIVSGQTPVNGPMGFFRLGCQPAPLPGNPPVVSAITADVLSNALTITFSEPVDSSTAANPANYFVGASSGPVTESPVQIRPNAVRLMLDSPLMPSVNYFLGVTGVSDTNGHVIVPVTFSFAAATLQDPCPGGELLVRHAYSECNPDGFWHVVEDDYYACPPVGAVQKFRVADTKTTQPCGGAQTPPSPVGLLYPTAADVASTCQSPVLIGQVTVYECVGGLWSASTYLKYQCLDGTIYLSGPVQNVPVNPPTGCDQPPPSPAH